MKPFTQRNPFTIGLAGMVVLVLAFLLAMNFERLPLVGGKAYSAEFSEAAGLASGNEVRVAGVRVGEVTGVELAGDRVRVDFRVSDTWLGDRTAAAIKVKTLLGQKFLALDPKGSQELNSSKPIPLQRTMAPYDVMEAFSDLSTTVDKVDTDQLARSFRTMSETFAGTPDDVRGALDGLSQLSQTIAKRDAKLKELLSNTEKLSKTVSDRNAEFERLLQDGNLLLQEIRSRRDSVHSLLQGTRELSQQLTALIDENNQQIGPALEQLDRVTKMLQRNQDNLDRSLEKFAPFTRLFANVLGNGRWFDTYICGLLPPAVGPINQKGCQP
ncbi:MCE family protein [Salinifilum aidingensis]